MIHNPRRFHRYGTARSKQLYLRSLKFCLDVVTRDVLLRAGRNHSYKHGLVRACALSTATSRTATETTRNALRRKRFVIACILLTRRTARAHIIRTLYTVYVYERARHTRRPPRGFIAPLACARDESRKVSSLFTIRTRVMYPSA